MNSDKQLFQQNDPEKMTLRVTGGVDIAGFRSKKPAMYDVSFYVDIIECRLT